MTHGAPQFEDDADQQVSSLSGKLIILIGPSGSGKSVIARRLAQQGGIRLYDTDASIRAREGGISVGKIFASHGENYFRERELECLDEVANLGDPCVVATGGGFPMNRGAMDRLLTLGLSIHLHATVEELWKRLVGDLDDRPLLQGGVHDLEALIAKREHVYRRATLSVDTSRMTVHEVCTMLRPLMYLITESAA
jgi:shikimate kinase